MDAAATDAVNYEHQVRQWAFWLHLSQLAGFLVPFAGLVAPIVIWQMKKDEMPELDAHGRVVANWVLSGLIYFAISIVLLIVLVGIPMLMLLGLAGVIFPIIGAIKANDGTPWKYPLAIPFFS